MLANHNVSTQTLANAFNRIDQVMKSNHGVEISVSIGKQFDSLNMFSKSYEDALYAGWMNTDGVTHTDKPQKILKNIFFTANDKNHLISKTLSADNAAVFTFFDSLITKIFVENTLTYRMLSYIRYAVAETLSEIVYKYPHDSVISKIYEDSALAVNGHNYMDSFKTLSDCFMRMCDRLTEIKNNPADDLRATLFDYIEQNYTNPDISLNQIASELHFFIQLSLQIL